VVTKFSHYHMLLSPRRSGYSWTRTSERHQLCLYREPHVIRFFSNRRCPCCDQTQLVLPENIADFHFSVACQKPLL